VPFRSRSGGIDGRPAPAYIASKVDDIAARHLSAIFLIRRAGCRSGTIPSGDIRQSIDDCLVSLPRM
jgi:hypothetical protein